MTLDKSGAAKISDEDQKVNGLEQIRSEEDDDKLKSIENNIEVQTSHNKVSSAKKKNVNTLLRFFSVKSVTKSGIVQEPSNSL